MHVVVESAAVVDGSLDGAVLVVPGAVRLVGAALVVALVVLHVVVVARSDGPRWRQVSEDLVLVAFFAVVPPVLAVGLYFTLWHAVRHILRLELTERPVPGSCTAGGCSHRSSGSPARRGRSPRSRWRCSWRSPSWSVEPTSASTWS